MARFEDYVKNDDLESEIQEKAEERRKSIPESVLKRFDGKSVEDVLESYAHLEQKLSQQGQDMGRLRTTVDQLLDLQSRSPTANPSGQDTSETVKPVDIDALYENPEEAIASVAERRVGKRVEKLEEELNRQRLREQLDEFTREFPDWRQEAASTEFQEWLNSSSYRTRLAAAADGYDFDAARDLLSMWNDHKNEEQKVAEKARRERALQDAELASSSPSGVSLPNSYSRSRLMEVRIKAKAGDREAERWLNAHAESIAIAYEEGRITD